MKLQMKMEVRSLDRIPALCFVDRRSDAHEVGAHPTARLLAESFRRERKVTTVTHNQINAPLRTVVVSEAVERTLLVSAPDIQWPTLTSGRNPGTLSIYIAIDREGHVRETLGLNSDNPIMTAAAREQVMKWEFKPATNNGERVQVESVLTFGYETKIVPAP